MDNNSNANAVEEDDHPIDMEAAELHQQDETTTTPVLNIVSHPGSIKMEKFDGKTSWRPYRRQFERVGKMNNWDNMLCDYLWIHLSGDALAFVEELPGASTMTYDVMCDALERRFGAERLSNVHKAQLLNLKRRSGQSLAELGQEVRRLVNNAYPRFNADAKEEISIEKFLDALHPETRRTIYQDNPTSLTQAIEKGLKIEAWSMVEESKHGKGNVRVTTQEEETDDDESEQVRAIRDLQEKVKNLQVGRSDRKTFACYNCGKPGHIARECLSKKRDTDKRLPQKGSRLTCFRCGGRGHISTDCATPENE